MEMMVGDRVRIGLLRHFPVQQGFPTGLRTAAEMAVWQESYDAAGVTVGKFDLGGITWVDCLSSDLPRAATTAKTVFQGKVEFTSLLREARFAPFQTGSLRLPVRLWYWMLRLAWMTGQPSQRACRDEFQQRVHAVADRLCGLERDTLVVSHAGMMAYLCRELLRRGFTGPKLRVAEHARAYVYEKA